MKQFAGVRRGLRRRGFTLLEVSVAMGVGAVLALTTVSLLITTYRTFATEMGQDEVESRSRELSQTFASDVGSAFQLVYCGSSSYYPPTLATGQFYTYPNNSSASPVTSVPAGTLVVVFSVPSYNASGAIASTYDYVGYTWTQPGSGSLGTLYRTCIINSQSSRPTYYGVVPGGGAFDTSMTFKFHVSTQFVNPTGTSYAGNFFDSAATNVSGTPLFTGSSPVILLQNIDEVQMKVTVAEASYVLASSQTLTTTVVLRDWARNPSITVPIPASPTNVTATGGINLVALTWTQSSTATSYNVKRSTTNGGTYTTVGSATTTSYTDNTAVFGNTYYYVVSAVNSGGESANSLQATATPLATPSAPAAPTSLSAASGVDLVQLTWTQSTNATSYNIYRSTASGGPYTNIGNITSTGFNGYTDKSGVELTTYYYVITAVNNVGESSYSNQTSAASQKPPIAGPTGLTGATGNPSRSTSLSWTQTTATGVTGNKLYRSTTSGGPYTLVHTFTSPATSYTDTSLVSGTTYYYVVTAVTTSGETANSTQASAVAK